MLDAPPTGRITQFLNVNSELAGLAKVGPIKSQADTVMTLFRSPRTAVHLVTVLEEMPVQETADGIAELREARLPVGGVVVNLVRPARPRHEDLRGRAAGPARPRRGSRRTSTRPASTSTTTLRRRAARRGARPRRAPARLEDAQRALVAGARTSRRTSCPGCAGGVDLGGLYELAAAAARQQGMA